MWEFLQAYGTWILVAVFILVMMLRPGGAGCGMGPTHQAARKPHDADAAGSDSSGSETGTGRLGGCH